MPASIKRTSYARVPSRGTGLPLPPDPPGCLLLFVLAFACLAGISLSGTFADETLQPSEQSSACPTCPSSIPPETLGHEHQVFSPADTSADTACLQKERSASTVTRWTTLELLVHRLFRTRCDDARSATLRGYLQALTRGRCRELLGRIRGLAPSLSIPLRGRCRTVEGLPIGSLSTTVGRFRAVQRYRCLFGFRGSAFHGGAYYVPRRSGRDVPRLHFRLTYSREE